MLHIKEDMGGLGFKRLDRPMPISEQIADFRIPPKTAIRFAELDIDPDPDVSWRLSPLQDQLNTPQCVGFATYHFLGSSPNVLNKKNKLRPDQIYFGAQDNDEWDGRDYEGSSATGAMRYLIKHPQIDVKSFIYIEGVNTIRSMIAWFEKKGPLLIGADRLEDMMMVDSKGFINVSGRDFGGHETLYYGYHLAYYKKFSKKGPAGAIDYDKSYFREANSWGLKWGVKGRCKINFTNFEILRNRKYSVDVVAPTKEIA